MKKINKKGLEYNFLIGLAIFILVIGQLIVLTEVKAAVKNKQLGMTQTALHLAASNADEALSYLDASVSVAAKQSLTELQKHGGMLEDPEGETFPCGSFMETAYWNKQEQNCIPNFAENTKESFEGKLFTILANHPDFGYPNILVTVVAAGSKTKIDSVPGSRIIIPFYGGGDEGFTIGAKASFPADYAGAVVSTALPYTARGDKEISYIVVHYTVTHTYEDAITVLLKRGKVGYHYIIDHDGTVYQQVPEDVASGHAGCLPEYGPLCKPGYNSISIGISFVNMGYEYNKEDAYIDESNKYGLKKWEPYTKEQLLAFEELVADIAMRYPALLENGQLKEGVIITHEYVNPKHKKDPGPAFTSQQALLEARINALLASKKDALELPNKEMPKKSPVVTETTENSDTTNKNNNAVRPEVAQRVESYNTIIEKYAKLRDLDPAFIKAIIATESEGNPTAKPAKGSASGLMQIIPSIHHKTNCVPECGFSADIKQEEYFDPEKNICCGTYILLQGSKGKPINWDCKGIQAVYDDPYEISARRYQRADCGAGVVPRYVEIVMEKYAYFGGNPGQFRVENNGNYRANYELPLGFSTELSFDLASYEAITTFATDVISICHDNTEACLLEKLEAHNTQGPEIKLNINCDDNPLAYEFMQKISSCMNMPEDWPCTLHFTEQAQEAFFLTMNEEGITEVTYTKELEHSGTTYDTYTTLSNHRQILQVTNKNYVLAEDITEQKKISFGFDPHNEKTFTIRILNGEEKFNADDEEERKELAKRVYTFTKKGEQLIYHYDEDVQGIPAAKTSFLLCKHEEKGRGLTFALQLEDRIPPAIMYTRSNYDSNLGVYELLWQPITSYTSQEYITDIARYDVYCLKEEPKPLTSPLAEDLAFSITRKEGLFPAEAYAKQGQMSAILDHCGTEDLGEELLYVTIIAVDAAGQYNLAYPTMQLLPPQDGAPSFALQITPLPEQDNEVQTPLLIPLEIENNVLPESLTGSKELIAYYYLDGQTIDIKTETSTPHPSGGPCPAGTHERRIGVFGSSSTENGGYITALNSMNAGQFFKHGYTGRTTGWLLKNAFQKDIITNNYDDVIIFAGFNDLPTTDMSMTAAKENLQTMYYKAQMAGIRVIAVTIQPTKGADGYWTGGAGREPEKVVQKTDELNNWILHSANNVNVRVDAYEVLEEGDTDAMKKEYAASDNVHLTTLGHQVLGETIYAAAYRNVARCVSD